jgi:exodeoxyribonuclease V alpha subunit
MPQSLNAGPRPKEISGLIERVTFHNDESGFCVLRLKTKGIGTN